METRKNYISDDTVKPENLQPAVNWRAPTASELAAALELAGWNNETAAERLGVGLAKLALWLNGEQTITYSAWCVICAQAGLGNIW